MDSALLSKFKNWEKNFVCLETTLGLTNKNYVLNNQFLLRKSSPTTIFFIQRENEINTLKLINNQAINVPVVDYFFDRQGNFIYITKFLQGIKHFAQLTKNKTHLNEIAKLIKKLHHVNYQNSNVKQLDMKQNLINHINRSEYKYDNDHLNILIKEIKEFLNSFDWEETVVLSHNDPLKENFLVDKNNRWYLIDYEYCSLNSPYYDVAVFASASELVKDVDLWQHWLNLFAITTKEKEKTLLFFVAYRDVLGYFWARCMNLYNPDDKYVQLMKKKLAQSSYTRKLIKKLTAEIKK